MSFVQYLRVPIHSSFLPIYWPAKQKKSWFPHQHFKHSKSIFPAMALLCTATGGLTAALSGAVTAQPISPGWLNRGFPKDPFNRDIPENEQLHRRYSLRHFETWLAPQELKLKGTLTGLPCYLPSLAFWMSYCCNLQDINQFKKGRHRRTQWNC